MTGSNIMKKGVIIGIIVIVIIIGIGISATLGTESSEPEIVDIPPQISQNQEGNSFSLVLEDSVVLSEP
jgi:hypothetical protein